MPIRKIPLNRRVPTGYFYSEKNSRLINCESPVEKDFYQTLEFDDTIEKYDEQPIEVDNPLTGKPLYPDCLIAYKVWTKKKPCLVEIKSEAELKDVVKAKDFKVKCKVLKEYAKNHNMDFKVVIDIEIRGQYLDNLKFLYKYRDKPQKLSVYRGAIIKAVSAQGAMTVSGILDGLAKDKMERALILPSIWHLLKVKALKTDLRFPLTNNTILEVKNEGIIDKKK